MLSNKIQKLISDENIEIQEEETAASSVEDEPAAGINARKSFDPDDVYEEKPLIFADNLENADTFSLCEEMSESYTNILETRNPAFEQPSTNDDDADAEEHDDSFDSFSSRYKNKLKSNTNNYRK